MRLAYATLFAAATAVTGCEDSFAPPSLLEDTRVLAILADPLEVTAGEVVTLTPVIFVPDGDEPASPTWSFCPFDFGGECAVPQCETPLDAEPDGRVRAEPAALALECARSLDLPALLPERSDTRFRLTLETGQVADLRVPLLAEAPAARNEPPVIAALEAEPPSDGRTRITLRVDPASLDAFVDSAGRDRTEEPITSFYVTAGELDADRVAGAEAQVEWTSDGEPALLYAVTRDLRGGQAVAGPIDLE